VPSCCCMGSDHLTRVTDASSEQGSSGAADLCLDSTRLAGEKSRGPDRLRLHG